MKSERNDHVAKSATGKREIDTTFHSDLRCRSSSPPPSPNPQSEKQSMLPNQVIRTGRSKLVSNQGPCRLVIFASELSPDVFTLQVKNGHLRQNQRAPPQINVQAAHYPRYNSTIQSQYIQIVLVIIRTSHVLVMVYRKLHTAKDSPKPQQLLRVQPCSK